MEVALEVCGGQGQPEQCRCAMVFSGGRQGLKFEVAAGAGAVGATRWRLEGAAGVCKRVCLWHGAKPQLSSGRDRQEQVSVEARGL